MLVPLKKAFPHIGNVWWRLDNLYWLINERGERVQFKLRPAQREFLKRMHWRNVILKARQLGFTTVIDLYGLDQVLFNPNYRAGIVAHTRLDAQTIFRDKVKYAYENLPALLRSAFPAVKNDAGELLLANNSSMRVGTSFRSSTANFLHVSEYGAICARYPKKATEIKTGSFPAIHEGGLICVESTAEGREGDFWRMCEVARKQTATKRGLSSLDYRFHFYPWHANPTYRTDPDLVVVPDRIRDYFKDLKAKHGIAVDERQTAWYCVTEGGAGGLGDDMLREHPSTPEEAFSVSVTGAYYYREMLAAWREGRIGEVPYTPGVPVETWWDIGRRDSTAIWFVQYVHPWYHVIDYYEASMRGLPHFVEVIKSKPYAYGRHLLPHDVQVTEWGTDRTRIESAARLNLTVETVPGIAMSDGIDAVRELLWRCRFDEVKCTASVGVAGRMDSSVAVGIPSLEGYRHEWDEVNGVWRDQPLHNPASHGADAFRTGAVGTRLGRRGDPLVSAPATGESGSRWGSF